MPRTHWSLMTRPYRSQHLFSSQVPLKHSYDKIGLNSNIGVRIETFEALVIGLKTPASAGVFNPPNPPDRNPALPATNPAPSRKVSRCAER